MPAYFVVELDVQDGPLLDAYERKITADVVAAGGKFLVRGNEYIAVEGDWHPKRLVIIEFPDIETIDRYTRSDSFLASKQNRLASTGGKPAKAVAIKGLNAGLDADGQPVAPTYAGVDSSGAAIWR